MTIVRIEKLRVFLLKSSWAFLTAVELHFNYIFSCSWAFSTTVELHFNRGPERFNRGLGKVQPGFFPRTSLVKTSWTDPRGGSTGVRVTWLVWPPVWQIDCQSDHQAVELALGEVQPVLGPVFVVWPDCQSAPGGWTGPRGSSTGPPQPKSAERLVLKPHLYILTPTSLPTQEHDPNSISNLRNTSHSLSHVSCLSHFKSLERNLWVRLKSYGFCASSPNPSCSSPFELWYYIELFVDSLLLELQAPRRLGVSCESPNLVEDHKKVCITRSFEQRLLCGLDLCGRPRED
jgi:hypothetical protein